MAPDRACSEISRHLTKQLAPSRHTRTHIARQGESDQRRHASYRTGDTSAELGPAQPQIADFDNSASETTLS
jgi:hypothetical protein